MNEANNIWDVRGRNITENEKNECECNMRTINLQKQRKEKSRPAELPTKDFIWEKFPKGHSYWPLAIIDENKWAFLNYSKFQFEG